MCLTYQDQYYPEAMLVGMFRAQIQDCPVRKEEMKYYNLYCPHRDYNVLFGMVWQYLEQKQFVQTRKSFFRNN